MGKQAFAKVIESNLHGSKDWTGKGLALYNLNKYDDATKAYDRAIEINRDPNAWTGKGEILVKLGKYNDAMKVYDIAIGINPRDSIALKGKEKLSKQNF